MPGMFDDLIPSPDFGSAISGIESGGNYRAVGPETGKGRALGKYQVMSFNVGPWSREALGREVTPQEFMSSPDIQEAVFKHKFGQYAEKYGPQGAAKAWFAGEGGMNNPNARDVLGTTVRDYEQKFSNAMAFAPEQKQAQPQKAISFDDLIPQPKQTGESFDARFGQEPAPNPELQAGLRQRAEQMTRGAPTTPQQNVAIDFNNQASAASQGTTPIISAQSKNLLSTEVFETDAGTVMFRDPQTGKLVETDQNKHVALRDPADGNVKIYARTQDTDEGALSSAGRLALPGMAAGAPTARAMIPAASKSLVPAASDIFATAKPHYREFTRQASQVQVPVETSASIAERLRGALAKKDLIEELAPAVYRSIAILDKGKPMTLDELQSVKRVIGRSFNSPDKNIRDAASIASGELSKVIGEIRPAASESLKKADAIHSTARSVQDLQRKGAVADLRAGRAGYGGNAVNSMRQVLSPIVQRAVEGKNTGFKPHEIAAMRDIVEGTTATNVLRGVGQLSPSKGIFQTGGAAVAGYTLGPGVGATIAGLGAASNKLATFLTGKQIDRLKELVAKRSPEYAKAVQKSVERYERAQMELVNKPSPAKFAAYLSASRAMASGLQRDGIPVTSGDLLKLIAGPGPEPTQAQEQE